MNQPNRIIVPNSVLLGEVTRLLSEGRPVVIPTKGSSMLPFIRGERDSIALIKKTDIEVGDIVLALIDGSRYVLHRVHGISGEDVVLMGDGNLVGTENCRKSDICGTATEIIKESGRKIDVSSNGFRRKSALWLKLLPVRRYLLFIIRRINKLI